MNGSKYSITLIIFFSFLFPIAGIGISGITIFEDINYTETEVGSSLELSYLNNGGGLGANFFIYFDALPMGIAIEYSKEIISNPLNVKMSTTDDSYSFDLFPQAQISDYFTIRKQIMELSIPFLASSSLYIGGGFNKHKTVFPSINLLKEIINNPNIDSDSLIDEFTTQNPTFNVSDFTDYFEDSNGAHIQAGIQIKILMLNAFINTRYTFITKNDSQINRTGFANILVGLALGL